MLRRIAVALSIFLLAGCASSSTIPNPMSRDVRASLRLADVKVSASSAAVAEADKATLAGMTAKLTSNLKSKLPASFPGTRPVVVDVAITSFKVDKRLLSSTPVTTAAVSIVDPATGAIIARYSAAHEEPIGVAVSAVMGTDAFIAQQFANTVQAHIESDTIRTDRAIPHVAGGIAGQVL